MLEAVNQLNSKPAVTVKKVSCIYETDPVLFHCVPLRHSVTSAPQRVGGKKQPDFLNAAVEIETVLDTQELVKVCLGIEQNMGRIRTERWGQRTIDIDLLLYGGSIINRSDVTVPHPLMHTRGFVLYPLSDIAPDVVHPVIGLTISQLLVALQRSGKEKAKIGHEGTRCAATQRIRKMDNLKLIV